MNFSLSVTSSLKFKLEKVSEESLNSAITEFPIAIKFIPHPWSRNNRSPYPKIVDQTNLIFKFLLSKQIFEARFENVHKLFAFSPFP
jgi:hypothetical protein